MNKEAEEDHNDDDGGWISINVGQCKLRCTLFFRRCSKRHELISPFLILVPPVKALLNDRKIEGKGQISKIANYKIQNPATFKLNVVECRNFQQSFQQVEIYQTKSI